MAVRCDSRASNSPSSKYILSNMTLASRLSRRSLSSPCEDYYFPCFDENPNLCDLCPLIDEYVTEDIGHDLVGNCGLPNPSFIKGQVFIDDNDNCFNDWEAPLANWLVAAVAIGTNDTTFAPFASKA